MTDKGAHLTLSERQIIETGISKGASKKSIADTIGKDKSTIGKEIKNHRISNVRLFKDSLVKIIGDVFDCYDLIINLFGGQCQII